MSLKVVLLLVVLGTAFGGALGYFFRWALTVGKKGSLELKIKRMMLEAQEEANRIIEKGEKKAGEIKEESLKEFKSKEGQLKTKEDRLVKKEELLDQRQMDIDKGAEILKSKVAEIKKIKEEATELRDKQQGEIERIAALSKDEAKDLIMKEVEKEAEEDILVRMKKLDIEGNDRLEKKAKDILISSIHRLGNSVSADVLSTMVTIPSDDVKGKVIGKEGKNIRAFERAAGVELIIDDTPGAITISSFDPIRRQIARVALENLIIDGRIQPVRIEEFVKKAKEEINGVIKEKGEQAVYECGIYNLDPRIVSILGRLHFRTSYGQNVLKHSIEMAHISGMLAEELGADVQIAKAGALLHDIGKAVDHEVEGTHVDIGRRILQKFGADEKIIKAMHSHHEEYPYETVESYIVQVADAISGGRPGARRDTVENYLKRLESLERIADSFNGIEKSYALQAGREIRVFVRPEAVDDLNARRMARNIAVQIEKELKYPGEIKVNVIRETRSIEYAR